MTLQHVPFFRPSIGDREINVAVKCLKSGWLTTGANVSAFEADFEELLGGDIHAVATNSATAAMHLALETLGIAKGDEVILPTLTFTATAEVVRYVGATPVFVDIDPHTYCIDLDQTEAAITSSTKVIMPVHFAGRSCDMTALRSLAKNYGLKIVDDAAHALPTRHKGSLIGSRPIGTDATAFSFYANKTMTTGEGGMLVMRDEALADRARRLRLHGIQKDTFGPAGTDSSNFAYDVVDAGFKYNLTDIAAAIGRVQLSRIDEFKASRGSLAAGYDRAFDDLPMILPPHATKSDEHAWHLYVVQLTDASPIRRDEFIQTLKAQGIETSVHYRPLHQMTYWKRFHQGPCCPNADRFFDACVSLPLYMSMSKEEHSHVVEVVRSALGQ